MQRILIEQSERANVVRFNAPATRNQLDDELVAELHAALDGCDPQRVLALRGNGDGFSAGRPHSPGGHPRGPEAAHAALGELVRLNLRIAQWAAPTLAFVHGYAHGAALGILQHVDIAVAAHGTRCSFPEITYNLPPALVASYLGNKIGEKATRYLIMTGDEIDAERARDMGLFSSVVAADALDAEASRLIAHVSERLEAEISMKATLREFSTYGGSLESDMERGVESVMRWARRPKVAS